MANLWEKFQGLIPTDPTIVADVTAHNPDGTSTVETLGGGVMRARGQSVAVGLKAYVRAGEVVGEAPDLPAYEVTI